MTKNICLIHGWGSNTEKLAPLAKALSELGWNVYTIPLPYFDLPEPNKPWSTTEFSQYVEAACARYFKQKKYFLFGHSNGGRIALRIIQRGRANLDGLILCSISGISRDPLFKRLVFKLISLIFSPIKKIPIIYAPLRKIIYYLSRNYDYYNIVSPLKQETFKIIITEQLNSVTQFIDLPTLILWGTEDKITPPKDAKWLNKKIKNSSLILYPQQRHAIPYTIPDKLAKQIDTWANKA